VRATSTANVAITDRVYIKNARRLSSRMDRNMPRNVFSGAALDILYNTDEVEKVDAATRDQLIDFITDFLDCDCDDAPYCGCPERRFVRYLIELRREGMSPSSIVESLEAEYGLYAYEGDVLDFLDSSVRSLEAIEEVADTLAEYETRDEARRVRDEVVGSR
jgi:superfamily II helicase